MTAIVALLISGLWAPPAQTQSQPQNRPDFSGKWVLFATADTGPAVIREMEVVHSREKGTISVTRRRAGAPQTDAYTMGTTSSGTVQGQRGPMTKARRVMGWDGPGLFLSDISSITRDSDSGREEYWTLDAQGKLKIEVTVWSPGNAPVTTSYVYIKQKGGDAR